MQRARIAYSSWWWSQDITTPSQLTCFALLCLVEWLLRTRPYNNKVIMQVDHHVVVVSRQSEQRRGCGAAAAAAVCSTLYLALTSSGHCHLGTTTSKQRQAHAGVNACYHDDSYGILWCKLAKFTRIFTSLKNHVVYNLFLTFFNHNLNLKISICTQG